jgi:hypothetical protein
MDCQLPTANCGLKIATHFPKRTNSAGRATFFPFVVWKERNPYFWMPLKMEIYMQVFSIDNQ